MKKFIFIIFLLFPLSLFLFGDRALAADRCTDWSFTDEKGKVVDPDTFYKSIDKINYKFTIKDADKTPSATYNIRLCASLGGCSDLDFLDQSNNNRVVKDNTITGTITNAKTTDSFNKQPLYDHFEVIKNGGVDPLICKYPIDWKDPLSSQSADCELSLTSSSTIPPITPDKNLILTGDIINAKGLNNYSIDKIPLDTYGRNPIIELRGQVNKDFKDINLTNSGKSFSVDLLNDYQNGTYTATAKLYLTGDITSGLKSIPVQCSITFKVPEGVPVPASVFCAEAEDLGAHPCAGKYSVCPWCPQNKTSKKPNINIPDLKPLCEQLHPNFQDDCKKCVNSPKDNPPGEGGIWSAIGCLPTDFSALINKYVFTTGVGIAGSIAFLYFIYGAFMILTSSGNAEKMEEAKQIITSSLAGLLLIIFSIFLLKTIGVDILKLPGFG